MERSFPEGGDATPLLEKDSEAASQRFTGVAIYNISVLSVAFMLLFSGYNSLQNFASSLLGGLGEDSLAILYVSVCLSLFFSPALVHRLGEKISLIFSSACFVVYMLCLVLYDFLPCTGTKVVVLAGSAFCGIGAASLWVAQGTLISRCSSDKYRGLANGFFWGIFQTSNIFGNGLGFYVFNHVSKHGLFITFTILTAVGTALFLALVEVPQRPGAPPKATQSAAPTPILTLVVGVLKMCFHPYMLLLAGMFFWTGLELTFWSGQFPLLLDEHVLGLVLACVGIGNVLGGLLGSISDKLGRSAVVVAGSFVFGGSLVLCYGIQHGLWQEASWLKGYHGAPTIAYIAALGFGLADSSFNTQTYAIIGGITESWGHESRVAAFTCFQLVQNVGSAIGFYCLKYIPLTGDNRSGMQLYIMAGIAVYSVVTFVACDVWRAVKRPVA